MRLGLLAATILAASALSLPVGDVAVEGNGFVSDSLIIRSFGSLPGYELRPMSVSQGIRNLFGLGYFSRIEVLADTLEDQVDLTISVSENHILSDYRFENPGELDVGDVRDSLTLLPGQTVSGMDVERARQIILGMYEEEHRHFAEVDARWEPPDLDGRSELVFECRQGPDVRVGEIVFTGNEAFSDDKLRGEMDTHEDTFWRSGRLRESTLREDRTKIEDFYGNHGYPYARVTGIARTVMEDGRHLRLDISVSEGRKYRFGRLSFGGNQNVPDSLLQKALEIETGEEFDSEELQRSLENIYQVLQDRGYFYAQASPSVTPENDSTLALEFRVDEGERAHIRRVDIVGNTRTHDNVIRRELKIYPGDLFTRTSLMRSIRNVYYLNYFNNVIPDFNMIEGSSDIDLIVEVEEKTTGRAGIGAGYSGQEGLNGYLELGESNLFGRGQSININYTFSKRRNDIQLGFTEPWFRDTPLSLGGELFHTTSDYTQYDRKRTGGAVTVGRPVPWVDFLSVSTRYTLEKVNVYNITDDSTSFYYDLRDLQWPRWTSSLRFTVLRDSRDRKVFPGEGSRNSISAEYAGGVLGGNIGFAKYLLDSAWHMPAFWKFFLTLRLRAGTIASLAGREPPAYELFELGGTGFYGLRGYDDNSIGAVSGFETVGGRTMMILSAEYRFRVIDQLQLSVFADAGDAWNSWSDTEFWNLNRGAGMGIRVEVPMLGVLGLDYAYGFDGPDRGWRPHFQIGTEF
ncbi:MAG: outer membrane protein assembly factor BamA [Candidatus Fermentibacteraceae bacterium]